MPDGERDRERETAKCEDVFVKQNDGCGKSYPYTSVGEVLQSRHSDIIQRITRTRTDVREVDDKEDGRSVAFGDADERGFLDMERHEFLVLSSTRLSVAVTVHRACWRGTGGRITFTVNSLCLIFMRNVDRTSATGKKYRTCQ